jgi:homoserine/homoserine lactone efflux protein
MEIENWLSFCSIASLATATPGPAALLVSSHSLSFGFKASLATILGNITALFIMSAVSILGLTALVMYSAFGFTLFKIMGAAYLIYIGVKLWRSGVKTIKPQASAEFNSSPVNLYGQGLLIALTNPKAIVFTTALFPQFISVEQALIPQFSLLVSTFMALSFICLSSYSLLAHKAKSKIKNQVSSKLLSKVFGGTFVAAGCYLVSTSE